MWSSWRCCEKVTQPSAPLPVIPRGQVGPRLSAMILYARSGENQPLSRQSEGQLQPPSIGFNAQ
jgi:transposase